MQYLLILAIQVSLIIFINIELLLNQLSSSKTQNIYQTELTCCASDLLSTVVKLDLIMRNILVSQLTTSWTNLIYLLLAWTKGACVATFDVKVRTMRCTSDKKLQKTFVRNYLFRLNGWVVHILDRREFRISFVTLFANVASLLCPYLRL